MARGDAAPDGPEQRLAFVRAYHEATKHGFHRFAPGPFELDWANQPDPFRRYAGAPLVSLELDPRVSGEEEGEGGGSRGGPLYDEALHAGGLAPVPLAARSLSRLLFDSFALSAWKQAGEARWSLRVDPSSGNLHPTEVYLLAPPIEGVHGAPSVRHYAPREHALELRAELPAELWSRLAGSLPAKSLLVGLSSIGWREAWKYGERSYRYCQHDVGHCIAALSIAAAGLGWRVELLDGLATEEVARLFGIAGSRGPEAERAECLLHVRTDGGGEAAARGSDLDQHLTAAVDERLLAEFDALPWAGRPNDLSAEHEEWSAAEAAFEATTKPRGAPWPAWEHSAAPAPAVRPGLRLRPIVRGRRSCLALDGRGGARAADFYRLLEALVPRAGRPPFDALPWSPRIDLALFVHRIDGLPQGLYWLARDPEREARARAACRGSFLWETPPGRPPELPLSLLLPMDLRRHATEVSCGQAIGGDGAFSLGMIADYERTLEEHGAWAYPRLFWEAGAVGQRLYLEVEALGLRGTGIGCFFDDPMHSILGLETRAFQSLYHFTAGVPVDDPRLTTWPAYPADHAPR